METDWEEEERGRYGLYLEICESNQRKHLWNAQVKQKRTKRLLNEPQEQRLIDCLMIRFYANFKGGTDYRSCAGNHNPSSQGILQFASSPNDRSSTHGNRTKRIFKPGEEENGDEEDGRPLKRPKRPTKPCEDRILGLKFACPYHQHNPRKYGVSLESSDADYRSCAGPGWRSVARIKSVKTP
jgi:hypothetical protein